MSPDRRPALIGLLALACSACSDDEVVAVRPKPEPSTPAWYGLFAPDARLAFVAEVERWFRSQQLVPELTAGGAMRVRGAKQGTPEFELGLLAELCAGAPRAEWPQLIAEQLGRVVAMRDALAELELLDWQTARARLRLRLHPESYLTEYRLELKDLAGAVDLPGTVTLAFIDSGESAVVVTSSSLERWKQDPRGVLAFALLNTRQELEDKLRIDVQPIGELGELHAITASSYYGSAAVLDLDAHPEMLGEHGAIVAVPTRDSIFVWPFADLRIKALIPALHRLVDRTASQMGSVIDRGLFWRRPDGRFERIVVTELDGRLEISPPPELAQLILELEKR
ncbi:MAG: hypothetical protein IT457_21500 [Planctomycetes bacterium]|nr:hypothetical protein [Planctomycetota bacterium]